jgi:hypothetical protein
VTPIPRGVADDGRLAVVYGQDGELVAVDPATGAVRWRYGRRLRPCAMAAGSVVAVRCEDTPGLEVVVLAADEGRELWTAVAGTLPPWARPDLADTPAFELATSIIRTQVVLRWRARRQYEGGAAPRPEITEAVSEEVAGAVLVDLDARTAVPLDREPEEGALEGAQPEGGPAPGVLLPPGAGPVRLEVVLGPGPGGADAVLLRGSEPGTGATAWELVLDRQPRRSPPKLRP